MKIAVRYFSKTGNTKKVADSIAKAAGVTAQPITTPIKSDVDILFLGTYVMAGGVTKDVKKFIQDINVSVGEVVAFSTNGINGSILSAIKKETDEKGLALSDKYFNCKGSFLIKNKNRPNNNDLQDARTFTKKIIG